MYPKYSVVDGQIMEVVNIQPLLGGILKPYTPKRNAVIVEYQDPLMKPVIHIECMNEDLYPMLRKAALSIYNNAVLQD